MIEDQPKEVKMWVFTQRGFVSIVADDNTDDLLVRGRFRGDVEALFSVPEIETPDHDYRFRALVSRAVVGARLLEIAETIDYPNFKDACRDDMHGVMLRVWSVMMAEQDRRTPSTRFSRGDFVVGHATKSQKRKARRRRARGHRYEELFGLPPLPDESELPWPAKGA